MIKTTHRKIGMTSCMLLALSFGLPSLTTSAHAQLGSSSSSSSGGLLNPSSFASNPGSLLTAPGGVGNNTLGLLMGGNGQSPVPSDVLASALGQQNGAQPSSMVTSQQDATGILNNIKTLVSTGKMDPGAASNLITGMAANALPPEITKALSGLSGLGQMQGNASDISKIFSDPAIQQLLQGKNAQDQAGTIDKIIKSAVQGGANGMQSGGTQALADAIKTQAPELAKTLEAMGPLGDMIQNALAGGLAALLGGTGSSSSSSSSSSSGGGGTKDDGNYELKSKNVDADPKLGYCDTCGDVGQKIADDYKKVRQLIKDEFIRHRTWMVNTYWKKHVLPAMMLMAEQLSVVGIQQVEMFGTMLDAKHQLETQRLFQQMTAQAHKDYHPSEGMCTFGTTVRSLAASERKSDLTQIALANRMMQRQTLDGDVLSFEGPDSDIKSRLVKFTSTYCDKADDANGLENLCKNVTGKPPRRNIDVDYTRNVESRLTLDIDMTKAAAPTEDQEDLFALAANLYAHNIPEKMEPEKLGSTDGEVRQDGAEKYLDMRAVFAKRSVAQNSFAAITAMRTSGDAGSAPYTKALIKELGITDQAEIEKILGKNPSYFAQMEVLTKKIYQNPTFYTELYDKPVNVERKGAAIQAISLMQDRDLYNSLLRSEAVLSVLLETMLDKEQSKVVNAMGRLDPGKESGGAK